MTRRPGERYAVEGGQLVYRELALERASDTGPIRAAISSDTPITRQGWLGDTWVEILDHGRDAVRMDRMVEGGPLLLDHDRRQHIGIVERAKLDAHALRAELRFSRGSAAQEIERDVRDGIRTRLSVGYLIWGFRLEAVEDDVETYRIIDWEPLEASLVSIPADLTVGIGRAHDHEPAVVRHVERRASAAPSITTITTPSPSRRREAWRDYLR